MIAFFANSIAFASSARLCDILKEIRLSHHAEGVNYHQLQKATIDEVTSVTKGFEYISIEAEKGLELLSPLMESGILDDAIIDIVDRLGFKTLKESTGLVETFSFLPVEEQIEMIDDIFLRLAQLFHGPKSKEQVIQLTELGRKFNLDKRELESLLSLFDNLDLSNVDDVKLGIFSYLSGDTKSLIKNIKRKKGYFGRIKKWLGIEKEVYPILVKNKLIRSTLPERTLLEKSELRLPSSQKKIFEKILGDVTTVEIREFARRNWEHLSLDETTSILNEIKKRRVLPDDNLVLALTDKARILKEGYGKIRDLNLDLKKLNDDIEKAKEVSVRYSNLYSKHGGKLFEYISDFDVAPAHKKSSRRLELEAQLENIGEVPKHLKYEGNLLDKHDELLKIEDYEELQKELKSFLEEIRGRVSVVDYTEFYSWFIRGMGYWAASRNRPFDVFRKFYDIFLEESKNYQFSNNLEAIYDKNTWKARRNLKRSRDLRIKINFNLRGFYPKTLEEKIIEEVFLERQSYVDFMNEEYIRLKRQKEQLKEQIEASLSRMDEIPSERVELPTKPEGESDIRQEAELEEGMRPNVESESLEERRRRARASQRSRN